MSLIPGAKFCSDCGQPAAPIPPAVVTTTPQRIEAEQFQTPGSYAPDLSAQPSFRYAGFWRRLLAFSIDLLLLAAVFGGVIGILSLLGGLGTSDSPGSGLMAFLPLTIITGFGFYFMFAESSSWQATIGKKVLRIYVTDLDGRRINLGRATGRTFAKYLSGLPLGMGYVVAGFSKKKQALHDMIANCLVLRRP